MHPIQSLTLFTSIGAIRDLYRVDFRIESSPQNIKLNL